MIKKKQYKKNLHLLLSDKKINHSNLKLFKKFFEEKEYKLKRTNGLKDLDEGCYKTLCCYIPYLRNVNKWVKNKDWKKLTREDIKKIYDGLEDEKLKGMNGNIIKDKQAYYIKIMRSTPFKLAGKDKIAREVTEYYNGKSKQEVRFFEEQVFQKIQKATATIKQKLLCWLAWDYGENIFSLLQLQKKNFVRSVDKENNEPEYILNFPQDKIKRSRTSRSEITNFRETVDLLDSVLLELKEEDFLFQFGHRNSLKFLDKIIKKLDVKCVGGQKPTWKDFRSSMACHLLDLGWTTDEIKARLGHKPSSDVLDKYVSYKAIGRHKPKQKVQEGKIKQLTQEFEDLRANHKLAMMRLERFETSHKRLNEKLAKRFKAGEFDNLQKDIL